MFSALLLSAVTSSACAVLPKEAISSSFGCGGGPGDDSGAAVAAVPLRCR
jgi:hypothetical protein